MIEPPAARGRVLRAGGVCVAGLVEVELAELGAGAELAVLGSLERRRVRGLGGQVGVEGRVPSTAVSWPVTQRVPKPVTQRVPKPVTQRVPKPVTQRVPKFLARAREGV
jgi:hypothetical protein